MTAGLKTALADRYLIEREIGRGGMATVYLAEDLKHQRMVALKVLHPELAVALGPRRFHREITIAAQLQHPNILPLLDSGDEPGGFLWFAMPYVEGESLRSRIVREHQLPLPVALQIARDVAAALEYAHQRGVIHRDVKPENILLSADGHTLLADFGVARDAINFADTSAERRITETGVSVGTLEYMSPEQTAGQRDVDGRTDVYSLGCVLYEMLAGEPPFTGATPQALVARRLVERPLPLRAVRDRIPASVERAVEVALARTPADRFGSAREFAEALESAARDAPGAATRRTIGWRSVVAGGAIAAALVLAFAWTRSRTPPDAAAPARLAVLPFENVGDSTAAYLASGIADAIRTKLSGLSKLEVIGRASSSHYKSNYKNDTTQAQVTAGELNAPYLLIGRVHSAAPIHIDAELEHVVPGAAPTTVWRSNIDSSATDIFQQESDIATKVADAVGVVPSASEAQTLSDQPTRNAAAYYAFLQGEARQSMSVTVARERATYYARAVSLDSTFGAAWAALAAMHTALYYDDRPTVEEATAAADALARAQALIPGRPETQIALAMYETGVHRNPERARAAAEAGLALAPDNVPLLSAAARVERNSGLWDAALAHARREALLDPRSPNAAFDLGTTLLYLRQYHDAIAALEHAMSLNPGAIGLIEFRTVASLGQGDTVGAHAVIHRALTHVDTATVVSFFAGENGLCWALGEALERRIAALRPADFNDDPASWAAALAEAAWSLGDTTRARAYADTAVLAFDVQLRNAPLDDLLHLRRGLMLAFRGQKAKAIEEGERGVALMPVRTYAVAGLFDEQLLAEIYTVVHEPDHAIDHLEALLRVPSFLSPARLRIDPTWASLRTNPRFQKLTTL
jgi:TolB-like protein/tetratricopeptide (TPR) repeat protein/tRNA A-37 threonylcarbamoyl transferase component Bud32